MVALFGPHAALILERAGDLAAAAPRFKEVLRNFRIVGLGMTRIAGSFYERIGKTDEARELYETFLSNQPGSTVFDLAKASEDDVLKNWQGLGYYSRARNLHYTAKYIAEKLKGVFPKTYKELLTLKGVGDIRRVPLPPFVMKNLLRL